MDDPRPYALLRITLGVTTFLSLLDFWPHLTFFYSDLGFFPRDSMNALQGHLHPISLLYLSGSETWVFFVYLITLVVSLLYAGGVLTRWMGPILWLCLASFIHRYVFVVDGSVTLLLQLLIPMMLVDTGASWSWDARRSSENKVIYSWLGVLLRFQLGMVYLASGLYKLMGADWTNGEAIRIVMAHPHWRRFDLDGLLSLDIVIVVLDGICSLVPFWEILFPLLVLHRYTRWLALGFGFFLHSSQWFTINTAYFTPILLSLYPLFLSEQTRATLWARMRSLLGQAKHG